MWQRVELICVVAARVYIEHCADMLNMFKVTYKGLRVMFFEVSPVFFLNLIFVTLIWFSMAGQRKIFSLISRRSQSHWLKCCSVELKTALQKFIGLIIAVSNIFLNINNSDTTIALISKVLYCIQQQLTYLRLYC